MILIIFHIMEILIKLLLPQILIKLHFNIILGSVLTKNSVVGLSNRKLVISTAQQKRSCGNQLIHRRLIKKSKKGGQDPENHAGRQLDSKGGSGVPRNFRQGVRIQAFTKLLPVADPGRANPAMDFGLPPTKKEIIVV